MARRSRRRAQSCLPHAAPIFGSVCTVRPWTNGSWSASACRRSRFGVTRTVKVFDTRILLLVLVFAVVAAKLPVLHMPAYWDEMAWLSQAHKLAQGPLTAVWPGRYPPGAFFGHPAGLHLILASLSRVFGFSIGLAHVVALAFAAVAVCFTFLLGRRLFDDRT